MPIEVYWYNDKKNVVYSSYSGIIGFEEIQASLEQFTKLTQNNPQGIHSIVDVTDIESFPTNLRDLKNIGKYLSSSSNQGVIIIIGANEMLRFVSNLVTQIARMQYYLVDTIEEAEAILAKISQDAPR